MTAKKVGKTKSDQMGNRIGGGKYREKRREEE